MNRVIQTYNLNQTITLSIWCLFFITPFLSPNIFQAPTAVGLMAFSTALFAAGWMSISPKYDAYIPPWAWLFLLLYLFPTAILLLQGNVNSPWQALKQCIYLTAAWLIYAMATPQASSLLKSPYWAALLAIIAHLYVIYALLQSFDLHFLMPDKDALFLVWFDQKSYYSGPFMQRNMQALFLLISIVFLWLHMIKHQYRWSWGAATIVPICGLLLTASRSGILILLIAAIIIFLLSKDKPTYALSVIWPIVLAWLIYSWILIFPSTESTLPNLVERVESTGVLPRILVWTMSLQIFFTHPWLGVGWGNLPAHDMEGIIMALDTYPTLANIASTMPFAHVWSHNIILQFLVEGGVFGATAIAVVLIVLFKQGWQCLIKKKYTDEGEIYAWLMSFIILTHGMVSISVMQPFFMALLALSLAACFSPIHEKS